VRRLIDLDKLHGTIEEALSVAVRGVQLPGIADAAVRKVGVSSEQLQRIAVELAQDGNADVRLSVEIELFLHISNTDVVSTIECTVFLVRVAADENDLRAVATSEKDWGKAWERGMEPIKQRTLQGIRSGIWNLDNTLVEDSYTFQVAIILLVSELVGPYVERIATFVGYPRGLVQVIGTRLQEAKIWENDEVRCEAWFAPNKGAISFMLDLGVAEGKLMRRWSEEKKQYAYRAPHIRAVSKFAV